MANDNTWETYFNRKETTEEFHYTKTEQHELNKYLVKQIYVLQNALQEKQQQIESLTNAIERLQDKNNSKHDESLKILKNATESKQTALNEIPDVSLGYGGLL